MGNSATGGLPIALDVHGRPTLPPYYHPGDEHRAFHVPPGWVEVQGYVPAHWIRIGNPTRMAVGDVGRKYDELMGERHWRPGYQLSPPPKGFWEVEEEDGRVNFVISDGRHRFVTALMMGDRSILVRWNSPDPQQLRAAAGAAAERGEHSRAEAKGVAA